MITIVLIVFPIVALGLVGVVVMQPSEFYVARSILISAAPATIFAQVNDFHKWETWNPWGKVDPAVKQTYDGAPAGTGAIYTWAGNREVGEGRMTLTESHPSELIGIKLEFFKPFAATNVAKFTFKPEGQQTLVTWTMKGNKNFMAKAIHLFINMDKMIGGQFEKGLASMKSIVEATPKP